MKFLKGEQHFSSVKARSAVNIEADNYNSHLLEALSQLLLFILQQFRAYFKAIAKLAKDLELLVQNLHHPP